MTTLKEKIAVMQAFEEGKEIECRRFNSGGSWAVVKAPGWNWDFYTYRVKREPRVIYVNIYRDGSMNCTASQEEAVRRVDVRCVEGPIKFVEVLNN